jgi:hypothetical protein
MSAPRRLVDYGLATATPLLSVSLGEAYSGSEKVCIVAFPDELPTVKALLNAYAIVLDDQLAEEIGHRLLCYVPALPDPFVHLNLSSARFTG